MGAQGFNALVLTHADGLRPFAIPFTRDREPAKDIYQETLSKAFAYSENYEPGTSIKAWLYTIMRHIFINEYQRNGRKKMVMETVNHFVSPYSLSSEGHVRLKEINPAIHYLPAIFKKSLPDVFAWV